MQKEGAGALLRVRQGCLIQRLGELAKTFIVDEEECAVLNDWSAKCAAELIANENRLDVACRLKWTDRIECCVADIVPGPAMKPIRPATD